MKSLPSTTAAITIIDHQPAVNTAAVATYSVPATEYGVVDWISFSYDVAPAAAKNCAITIGGTTVWSVDIGANLVCCGPHHFNFGPQGLASYTLGADIVATLAAGGATQTGKIAIGVR